MMGLQEGLMWAAKRVREPLAFKKEDKQMKTKMLIMYLHERAKAGLTGATTKKSGKPARPMRGPKCGVGVAMVLDDKTYATNYSIVNPGRETFPGFFINGDVFDKHIAVNMTIGKIMAGAPKPALAYPVSRDTKRGAYLRAQIVNFEEQAAKIFHDKTSAAIQTSDKPEPSLSETTSRVSGWVKEFFKD